MDTRWSWISMAAARLALVAALVSGATVAAGEACHWHDASATHVAMLVAEASLDELGLEARAASELVGKLAPATLLAPAGDGTFVDQSGRAVRLEQFQVIWHHQGDSIDQTTAIYDPRSIAALREYLREGGGLFLSGAALAMVYNMGIEQARPRLGGPGKDKYLAQLIPVSLGHPIFKGLARQGVDLPPSVGGNERVSTVPISDAGFPAFADFHGSGGPLGGMLLAWNTSWTRAG